MTKTLIAIFTITVSMQAFAGAVRFNQPISPALQERATDLVIKKEKGYTCILEGSRMGGGLFDSNSASVDVTAASLQDAAELALTPYVVVQPAANDRAVQIQVDKAVYSVTSVSCKPNGKLPICKQGENPKSGECKSADQNI